MVDIKKLVKEEITLSAYMGEEQRAIVEAFDNEFLSESLSLFESIDKDPKIKKQVEKIRVRGLEKYKMKFLERGDDRFFIGKNGGEIEGVHFVGNKSTEVVKFDSEGDATNYIKSLIAEGYKVLEKDSEVARFFKAISRLLGRSLRILGMTTFIGGLAFLALSGSLVYGGTALGAATALGLSSASGVMASMATVSAAAYGVAGAVGGMVLAGAGWLALKAGKTTPK